MSCAKKKMMNATKAEQKKMLLKLIKEKKNTQATYEKANGQDANQKTQKSPKRYIKQR